MSTKGKAMSFWSKKSGLNLFGVPSKIGIKLGKRAKRCPANDTLWLLLAVITLACCAPTVAATPEGATVTPSFDSQANRLVVRIDSPRGISAAQVKFDIPESIDIADVQLSGFMAGAIHLAKGREHRWFQLSANGERHGSLEMSIAFRQESADSIILLGINLKDTTQNSVPIDTSLPIKIDVRDSRNVNVSSKPERESQSSLSSQKPPPQPLSVTDTPRLLGYELICAGTILVHGDRSKQHYEVLSQSLDLPSSFLGRDAWVICYWSTGKGGKMRSTLDSLGRLLAWYSSDYPDFTLRWNVYVFKAHPWNFLGYLRGLRFQVLCYHVASESHLSSGYQESAFSSSYILKKGLVSHWGFDEAFGSVARDSVDNNHATIFGATWSTGKFGGALSFDGVDDYVLIPKSRNLPYGACPRTIIMWIYTRHTSWQRDINNIFYYGTTSLRKSFGLDMDYYPNMEFYTWGDEFLFDAGVPPEGWVHIAIVYDGNRAVRIYSRGELRLSKTLGDVLDTVYADMEIGSFKGAWWASCFFDGLVDEVAIYNRALTSEEIQMHYLYSSLVQP